MCLWSVCRECGQRVCVECVRSVCVCVWSALGVCVECVWSSHPASPWDTHRRSSRSPQTLDKHLRSDRARGCRAPAASHSSHLTHTHTHYHLEFILLYYTLVSQHLGPGGYGCGQDLIGGQGCGQDLIGGQGRGQDLIGGQDCGLLMWSQFVKCDLCDNNLSQLAYITVLGIILCATIQSEKMDSTGAVWTKCYNSYLFSTTPSPDRKQPAASCHCLSICCSVRQEAGKQEMCQAPIPTRVTSPTIIPGLG